MLLKKNLTCWRFFHPPSSIPVQDPSSHPHLVEHHCKPRWAFTHRNWASGRSRLCSGLPQIPKVWRSIQYPSTFQTGIVLQFLGCIQLFNSCAIDVFCDMNPQLISILIRNQRKAGWSSHFRVEKTGCTTLNLIFAPGHTRLHDQVCAAHLDGSAPLLSFYTWYVGICNVFSYCV